MPLDTDSNSQLFQPIDRSLPADSEEAIAETMLARLLKRPIKQTGPSFFEHAPRKLPSGWERETFVFEGLNIPYHIARAVKENAVVACVSGLKPDHAVSKKIVKAYKKRGISVIWINLPNPGRGLGYIDFYKRLSDYFYTSPESPFHTKFPKELKRFTHGHSTGATLNVHLATSPDTKHKYSNFPIIIPEALFGDNANAAEHDSIAMQLLFTTYAHWNKGKLPHETLLGLGYNNYYELKKRLSGFEFRDNASKIEKISFKAAAALYLATQSVKERLGALATEKKPTLIKRLLSDHFIAAHNAIEHLTERLGFSSPLQFSSARKPSEFETPTFGQILETRKFGRQLRKRLVNTPDLKAATNIFMVASSNDQFSSLKPQQDIAKSLGVPIYITDVVGHNPLSEDKHARKAAIGVIESLIPEVQKLPKELRSKESPESDSYWPEHTRATILRKTFMNALSHTTTAMQRLARMRLRSVPHTQPESVRKPS